MQRLKRGRITSRLYSRRRYLARLRRKLPRPRNPGELFIDVRSSRLEALIFDDDDDMLGLCSRNNNSEGIPEYIFELEYEATLSSRL